MRGEARADRLMRAITSTPALGATVAFLSWPIRSISPTFGPDPSWLAGLYMALDDGLRFGNQVVFTYGPLGFLQQAVLYDEGLWMLALLYRGFIHVALAISLLWVGRRAFPLAVALAVTYMLLVTGYLEAEAVLLAFIWCFVALGDRPPRFAAPLVAFGGGLLAAIELLGKANFGVAVFALCVATVAGMPERRRNVPLFAATTVASFAAFWVITGQGLSGVPDSLSNSAQLISGYSRAMGTNITELTWELPLAVTACALLLAATAVATRRDPPARRGAALALVALFAFLNFKQGFVRQGLGNTPEVFALLLGAGIAVSSRLPGRLPKLPRQAPAIALITPLVALTIATLPSPSFWGSLKPDDHMSFMRQDLDALFMSSERDRLVAEGRRSMRSTYRLDARTLSLVGDRPVHIDPWEIGVAWAYDMNWRPLPVIQGYSAYTPDLDRLNAEALSRPDGPELILRHKTEGFAGSTGSINDRYPAWDPPAANLAMLCNFQAVRTTRHWQLLERVGNRCGPSRPIAVVHSQTGEEIHVPPPPGLRDVVFARIRGLEVGGWETLRAALYRARERTVSFDHGKAWALVPETASDGLMVGASKAVDFQAPFQLAPEAQTLEVKDGGSGPRRIEVRFFARALRHGPEREPKSVARRSIGHGSQPIAGV